jgi:hypothetical protein
MAVSTILNTFARVMGPRLQTTKPIGKSGVVKFLATHEN